MLHNLSLRLANFLVANGGLDPARIPVVAYGLEVILGVSVKLFCFLVIPFLFGVLPGTLAAFIASALFRLPAGGAHCSSFGRCLFGSLLTFMIIGQLAKLTGRIDAWALPVFYFVIGLAALITILRVPVDNPNRPVKQPAARTHMRNWALAVLGGYLLGVNILPLTNDVIFAASLGILLQTLTLLPMGYCSMQLLDKILIKTSRLINRKRGDLL